MGLLSCYGEYNNADPYYFGEFSSSDSEIIDSVEFTIYYGQNRGLETLVFYLPLIEDEQERCGMFFYSFSNLTDDTKAILRSVSFTDSFESFVEKLRNNFRFNPPTKG